MNKLVASLLLFLTIFSNMIGCGVSLSATTTNINYVNVTQTTSTSATVEYSYYPNIDDTATLKTYQADGTLVDTTTAIPSTVLNPTNSYILTDLEPNTQYFIQLQSDVNNQILAESYFTTPSASVIAEGYLNIVNIGENSIDLNYFYKPSTDATSAYIEITDPNDNTYSQTNPLSLEPEGSTGLAEFTTLESGHIYQASIIEDGDQIVYLKFSTRPFVTVPANAEIFYNPNNTTTTSFEYGYRYTANDDDVANAKITVVDESLTPVTTEHTVVEGGEETVSVNGLTPETTYKIMLTQDGQQIAHKYVSTKPELNPAIGRVDLHSITATTANFDYTYYANDDDPTVAFVYIYEQGTTIDEAIYVRQVIEGGEKNITAFGLQPDTNYVISINQGTNVLNSQNFKTTG